MSFRTLRRLFVVMKTTTMTAEQQETIAQAFLTNLEAIKLDSITTISTERHVRRTDRAKEVRKLFSTLKIKGCSVTAPNYSMACTIDIRTPKFKFVSEQPDLNARNTRIRELIESILLRAYPTTDNRSDYSSDYFDYCWSIN